MTGNKHRGDRGEPDPDPYLKHVHRDRRFWIIEAIIIACLDDGQQVRPFEVVSAIH